MRIKFLYSWERFLTISYRATGPTPCSLCGETIQQNEVHSRHHGRPVCWSCRPFVNVKGSGPQAMRTTGLPELSPAARAELPFLPTKRFRKDGRTDRTTATETRALRFPHILLPWQEHQHTNRR